MKDTVSLGYLPPGFVSVWQGEYCHQHENSSKNIYSKMPERAKKGVLTMGIVKPSEISWQRGFKC